MPHFAVDVNNVRITTINLAAMRVMDVSVHGALDRALKAAVDAMGGSYEEGGCGHLTWVMEHPLRPGDIVRVHLNQDEAKQRGSGLTFGHELFPKRATRHSLTDFLLSSCLNVRPDPGYTGYMTPVTYLAEPRR